MPTDRLALFPFIANVSNMWINFNSAISGSEKDANEI
jgi:hypothetical protein